jgi:DNA mismatch endonuclease (patch repair protein)
MPRRSTGPELAIRRELHRRGLRFRVDHALLPGRPDIVFTRARVVVFVDGCFWHRCPEHGTLPRNNAQWWLAKLDRNVARDRSKDSALAELGWAVIHVWEHESPEVAADRVEAEWRRRRVANQMVHGAGSRRKPDFPKSILRSRNRLK